MSRANRIFSYDPFINGESEILEKLSPLKLGTIFDVGCNIGRWAFLALHHFPEAQIHTFELSNETFKTTAVRLAGESFINNNFGLSNKREEVVYKDYGPNSGVNTLIKNSVFLDDKIKPTHQKAFVSTGDIYCAERNIDKIDFLKIDVEGAEHLVLEGFSRMLKNEAIRIIQFEYGYAHGDAKFLMRDFFDFLRPYRYRLARIETGGLKFREWTYALNNFDSGPNYIAIRDDDGEVFSILTNGS